MLTEKIKKFIVNGKPKSKEVKEIMEKSLMRLQDENIEKKAIKVGEKLPDFELLDAYGNIFTKESFLGKKLVLNFFRGSW